MQALATHAPRALYVSKAHRLLYHSTLGLRVIKKTQWGLVNVVGQIVFNLNTTPGEIGEVPPRTRPREILNHKP